MRVYLVGPDGSGKSSVSASLAGLLERRGFRVTVRHGAPRAGRRPPGERNDDPHGRAPRGPFVSALKIAASLSRYALLMLRTRDRPFINVIERGWDDQAVDPARYRLPRSYGKATRLLGRIFPKSDLTVLLAGDAATLEARKPELTADEIEQQIIAWRRLAPSRSRTFLEVDSGSNGSSAIAALIANRVVESAAEADRWCSISPTPPRLDLRVSAAAGALVAARVYEPIRTSARLGAVAARFLYRAGIRRPAPNPVTDLRAILAELGFGGYAVAAIRSSREGRFIVGVADGSELVALVKVGGLGDEGLANEARFLQKMQATQLVPRLVSWSEQDGWRVLCTKAVDRTRRSSTISIAQAHELATFLQSGSRVEPTVHGDFTPWNLIQTHDRLVLVDWEFALAAFRPLHDLAHFVIQTGGLLKRWSPEEAVALLTSPESPGAAHLAALNVDTRDAGRLVHDYLAAAPETSDPKLFEFRERTGRLLG